MAIRSATDLGGRPAPWVEAAGELGTVVTPLRFLVDGDVGDAAHPPDEGPVWLDDHAGEAATWRLVHERHELVREAGHGAADADAADVGAAAHAVHPAALGHVAVDDRPPAADLHLALRRVVVAGEVALLVVGGAVAALVHGPAE